jgi:hypothetical protein
MQWMKDEFTLTDDSSRLDLERTFMLLHRTYWGVRRPREVVAKMIEHSLCLVLLQGDIQIGFGRSVNRLHGVFLDCRHRRGAQISEQRTRKMDDGMHSHASGN